MLLWAVHSESRGMHVRTHYGRCMLQRSRGEMAMAQQDKGNPQGQQKQQGGR